MILVEFFSTIIIVYYYSKLVKICINIMKQRKQNQNISFCPRGAWQIVVNSALSASPAGEATAPQVRKTFQNTEIVNWRRERDSNPRYLAVHTLSRRAH